MIRMTPEQLTDAIMSDDIPPEAVELVKERRMTFDEWFKATSGPCPTEIERDAALRAWTAALVNTPPDAQFLSWLPAYWQACGPWVPEDSLSEEGKAIRAAFVELFSDGRFAEWFRETT